MKIFLKAKWQDLVLINYVIDPVVLQKFVPLGTALDIHDEKCFVSLVSFKFLQTKMLGVSIPFHANFEEVNLRFYVTRKEGDEIRRGVVFLKEIVPKPAISFVANTVYGERYETWEMEHVSSEREHTYFWKKGGIENRVHVEIASNLGIPEANSQEEFIVDHYWGYTRRGEYRTDEYRVEHPNWELFDVNYAEISVSFGKTYGEQFGFLTEKEPDSVIFAKGSEISVSKGRKLKKL